MLSPNLLACYESIEWLAAESWRRLDHKQSPRILTPKRREVALGTLAAAINYSQAIVLLCRNFNDQAPLPLLRTLLESRINLAYLLQATGDERILLATKERATANQKAIKRLINYTKAHPDQAVINLSTEILQTSLEKQKEEYDRAHAQLVKESGKAKVHESLPPLWQRAEACDEYAPNNEPILAVYCLMYPQWSSNVHLGLETMPNWVRKVEKSWLLNVPASNLTLGFNAWATFRLLEDILTLTLSELGMEDEQLTKELVIRSNKIAAILLQFQNEK